MSCSLTPDQARLLRRTLTRELLQIDEALGTANETAGSLTDPPEAKE